MFFMSHGFLSYPSYYSKVEKQPVAQCKTAMEVLWGGGGMLFLRHDKYMK